MKLQDEHSYLSLITNQIIIFHEEGGFWTEVMGWCVCVKLWIHFIAGGTSGHNNLVRHMNGGWPIRNGIMPHLWGINLLHIYAREVR